MGGRRPDKVGKAFLARLKHARSQRDVIALAEAFHGRAFVLLSLMIVACLALAAFAILAAQGLSIDIAKINDPLRAVTFNSPAWLTDSTAELGFFLAPVIALGVLVACSVAMGLTRGGLATIGQHQSDRQAASIYETLRTQQQAAPFVFYLPGDARGDLEAAITRSAWQIGPLVCLGEPLSQFGAGRIKVADEEQLEAAKLLAQGARLIVLGSSQGGSAAQYLLDSDLIARTVFIDPPASLRTQLLPRGYALPDATTGHQLIYFGDGKSPRVTARFERLDPGQMFRFFQMVAADQQPEPADGEDAEATASLPAH